LNWYFDWNDMNWYKTAQIIIDDDSEDPVPYTNIGHNSYTDKALGVLWFWINGKLVVEEEDYRGLFNHEKMLPGAFAEGHYKGRYDPNTNVASLVRPTDKMFKPVPKPLIKTLSERFGEITIRVY